MTNLNIDACDPSPSIQYQRIADALRKYAEPGVIGITGQTLVDIYDSLAALSRRIDWLEAQR